MFLAIAVPLRALYWRARLLAIPPRPRDVSTGYFDVICFSHVHWSHVWQRNHHTMNRLARDRKVIYFQTTNIAYIHRFAVEWPRSFREYRNRDSRVKLIYPLLFPGEARIPGIRALNSWLLATHLRWLEFTENLQNPVLWFYYPAVVQVLERYSPDGVVYDIQDEYSAFDWSPVDIGQRERYLVGKADIIFAGTQTLFERKTVGFPRAWFYPCAVEFEHFNAAAPEGDHSPPLQPSAFKSLRRPRLAYAGLIDKRIDEHLLIRLGRSHPDWEIVMIGPVDERLFNHAAVTGAAPNVLFVDQVDYQNLPAYLAHCDVYIMPWHVNDLTRHINPTKTLEYLAAGRPVVSINLPDLENLFSDCVSLADTHEQFIAECEAALAGERQDKVIAGLERARTLSWDTVVNEMTEHVQDAITARHGVKLHRESRLSVESGRDISVKYYTSTNGSHWRETKRFRPLENLPTRQRFWFLLGHLLLIPFALIVLLLTTAALPLYWYWDYRRRSCRPDVKTDPVAMRVIRETESATLRPADETVANPAVSVIIPFYNRGQWVDRVIRSVLAQEVPEGTTFEVIAVDNNSTDNTAEILQTYPIRVVRCLEPGPAAARNAGIAVARAPIIAFTDSDCIAAPNWLANLTAPFADPAVLLTGGTIASLTQDDFASTFTDREHILDNHRFFHGSAYFPRFFATANSAARRDAILQIGSFDTSLSVGEDADISWRLLDRGGRMAYVETAVVYHQHRESLAGLFSQAVNYGAASVQVFAKHRSALNASSAVSWYTIKHTARLPVALARDAITAPTTFEKQKELYQALWRLGFLIGCIKGGVAKRVLFL